MASATFEEIEMTRATVGDFDKDWTIRDWTVEGEGPIPRNTFVIKRMLGIRKLTTSPDQYEVTWTAGDNQERSIRLTRQENGTLSDTVDFSFGSRTFRATVTFSTDGPDRLKGTLAWSRIGGRDGAHDGNTGTFAADTNPPLPDTV